MFVGDILFCLEALPSRLLLQQNRRWESEQRNTDLLGLKSRLWVSMFPVRLFFPSALASKKKDAHALLPSILSPSLCRCNDRQMEQNTFL